MAANLRPDDCAEVTPLAQLQGLRATDAFPPRPPARLRDATTTLADFAIITFAVDPPALAALLPKGFDPEVFPLADGRRVAFVSAVPFRDLDFRFGFAPWLKFRFCQTNYRAYVTYRVNVAPGFSVRRWRQTG